MDFDLKRHNIDFSVNELRREINLEEKRGVIDSLKMGIDFCSWGSIPFTT